MNPSVADRSPSPVPKLPSRDLLLKTRLVTLVVVLSNVAGNLFLSLGMRHGLAPGASPVAYLEAIFRPWVLLGISLLILWMLSRMMLLSWADLSYVLPVTSIGYALSALAGKLFLGEQISPQRWAAILLIVLGTALVAATEPDTTSSQAKGTRG
ncbi:MAG: EamA family transporter [Acidobacteria bacterium]|nr:EamA family transporter [Acidobacteriota bacterium]